MTNHEQDLEDESRNVIKDRLKDFVMTHALEDVADPIDEKMLQGEYETAKRIGSFLTAGTIAGHPVSKVEVKSGIYHFGFDNVHGTEDDRDWVVWLYGDDDPSDAKIFALVDAEDSVGVEVGEDSLPLDQYEQFMTDLEQLKPIAA